MSPPELREVIKAQPFQPFTLGLADGRIIPVPHIDYISLSPGGWTAIIWKDQGGYFLVDVASVTALEVQGAHKPK